MTTFAASATVAAPPTTLRRRVHQDLPWSLWLWGGLAALFVLLGIFGPFIAGNVTSGDLEHRLLGVGVDGHLLGTDGQGRDVFARILAGARPSMIAALSPVIIAGVIGSGLGITAGMGGKLVHGTIMRVLDVFYAFPAVLLAVAVGAALGAGTLNSVIALSVVLIPPIARIAETETAALEGMDFMETAKASGASGFAIALRQVLPNVFPALAVYCTSLVGLALVFAGGMSFLGLGVAPPAPEWGQMISEQRQYMFTNPSIALVPAVMIFIASMVFNLLGDALRDVFDIRRRTR